MQVLYPKYTIFEYKMEIIRIKPTNYLVRVVSFIIIYMQFEMQTTVANRKVTADFYNHPACI